MTVILFVFVSFQSILPVRKYTIYRNIIIKKNLTANKNYSVTFLIMNKGIL